MNDHIQDGPDEWIGQDWSPIVRLLPQPPPPYPSIYESARRVMAEYDRSWVEEQMDSRLTAYPTETWNPTVVKVAAKRVPERHNQWHRWDHTQYLPIMVGGPGWKCRDCPVFVSEAELRDWDGPRFPDEPGRVLDAIVTRRNVRTEFVTTLEQEMRNRSDGLVDTRPLTQEEQLRMLRDVQRIAHAPHASADRLRMADDEERRVLDAIHRQMDELHVPPFDAEAADARGRAIIADSDRRVRAVADGSFWDLSYLDTPITHPDIAPPRKWSWAWWCREWRFLTLRLRWWAIKRLGGDA